MGRAVWGERRPLLETGSGAGEAGFGSGMGLTVHTCPLSQAQVPPACVPSPHNQSLILNVLISARGMSPSERVKMRETIGKTPQELHCQYHPRTKLLSGKGQKQSLVSDAHLSVPLQPGLERVRSPTPQPQP